MLLSLFLAQANRNNGDEPPVALFMFLIMFVCGFYLVLLLIGIFFLLTLSKALGRCRPYNRTMEPGMVWLNLIPLFNLVWWFITVIRVGESLDNEFYERGWHRRGEDYGKTLGITTFALNLAGFIPYCGIIFSLASLVCWIVYWVKIANFSAQLASRAYARYDDDYDDRKKRRKRDRDDRDDRDDEDDRDDRDEDRRPWERDRR